jgi:flagellar protein FliT
MTMVDTATSDGAVMAYYESVCHVTGLMLRAAQDQDWETLVEAQTCCAQLIDQLEAVADKNARLAPDHQQRKQQIIRKVLAADAEIRRLTQPWLCSLENLLGSASSNRQFDRAYGA